MDRQLSKFYWAFPLLWIVGGLVGKFQNSSSLIGKFHAFPLKCPLKFFTDLDCPTCGLGRSLLMAFTGNFAESLHYHPGGMTLYVLSYVFFLQKWLDLPNPAAPLFPRFRWLGWLLLGLYTVWGFTRNLHLDLST